MKMSYNPSINGSMNSLFNGNRLRKVYFILQLILYVTFMFLDIINSELYMVSNTLKFSSIILCFIYVCLTLKVRTNNKDAYILLAAMFFTLLSDWFILMKDSFDLGLITFILVQYMYLFRIHLYKKTQFILLSIARNIIISIIVILFVIKANIDSWILSLVIVYLITFIFNIIDTTILCFKLRRKELNYFLLGLILFILCDINVGLFNLENFVSVNPLIYEKIYPFVFLGMWFFYLPSQVILSVSELS